jgi:protein-disulfide isomerase
MLRSFVRVTVALVLVGAGVSACAKTDAHPVKDSAVAGGDVAPQASPAGLASGLTDSVSTKADRGRIRGAESAPVWVVEISDFQCPFCKQWHDQVYAALDSEYVRTGKVRLAYLNFPLTSIHANAQGAAEAAMCASVQGKFWEVHQALFTAQKSWESLPNPIAMFESLVKAAGVEPKAWRSCVESHATKAIIDADRDRSAAAGVGSTPTFFIGDRKVEGAMPLADFRLVVDSALAKASRAR